MPRAKPPSVLSEEERAQLESMMRSNIFVKPHALAIGCGP